MTVYHFFKPIFFLDYAFFGKCHLPTFSYWADALSAQTQFPITRGWQDII